MEMHSPKFKVRLGLFVVGGLGIFVMAVFLIGRQKNLFDPVFNINATFRNVSGLQVGSNCRFSGINVGTVDNITIINDSTVRVDMLIRQNVHRFLKADCQAAIGTAGIIGDRVLTITQGGAASALLRDGQRIASMEPVEMDAIMASLLVTADNAAIISAGLAGIVNKVNSGSGTLGRLVRDSTIAENLNQTIANLKQSSKGLDENMNAAKENFLLKGYFERKEKAAEKTKDSTDREIRQEKRAIERARD